MYRATLLIFSLVFGACSGPSLKYEIDADAVEPENVVLDFPLEKVWRATQLALVDYPIRINNVDGGLIETELIRGDQGFRPPGLEENVSGRRYKIRIRIFKVGKDKLKTKVIVHKTVQVQKNFFSSPERKASDGLEELAIIYRIERELLIDQASNPSPSDQLDL